MPITPAQKSAMEEVISAILAVQAPRGRRQLAGMFTELVDRTSWPQYYEVIPEPRCLKNIQTGIAKGRYKEATDVYTDLSLVFWNALFYNEADSQIALDAKTLKDLLESEWKKRTVLPITRSSPPPSSAQKVHAVTKEVAKEKKKDTAPTTAGAATPAPSTPALPTPAPLPIPAAASTPARTVTPAGQNQNQNQNQATATPTASTSTSSYAYTRPVPIRPKSAQRQTPDIDVDVVSPDSDEAESDGATAAFQADRDPQSEEIVKQLEKGLPRWPGFGEDGWMAEAKPERFSDIVHALKTFKDIIGNRLAVCLESVPEESSPTLHLSSTSPISLKQIETRTRHKLYKSAKEFDHDMARLFEKARRWHDPGTEAYGRTLLLQRLYQALTSPNPPAAPYISTTNFAALRAGPGNVKPVHGADSEGIPNVTTHRVLSRDRTFVDEVNYKGWKIKLADWVHLSNPDDPSRPIIGQVFRCWVSDEYGKSGRPGITVSWYYRPEQTFHPSNRQFWEGEVFKTSHFADHPVEDIIEKIACQFTARHIRGRPRPPFWYVGFPLYVCDSRYNDRDRVFVRIKNWNSCVPEEVRQSTEFMPIYPFERTVYPVRHPSPFVAKGAGGKIKGPGGILEPSPDLVDGVDEGANSKKRSRSDGAGAARVINTNTAYATPYQNIQAPYVQQQQQIGQRVGPDRSVVMAAGGLASIGGPSQVEKLPPDTAKLVDRDPETNEVLWFAAPPLNMARANGPRHSLAYLQFLAAKRKKDHTEHETDDDDKMDHDEGQAAKRARTYVAPTVTETMQALWREMFIDGAR
ncbi:hypothetical protein CVT25_009493 [Psilocybe cyanescens]|uniref:Bromo domain-containing protein n=1 Tax=Psilocybe cyanescens TaxID=93625 RepID=A0A409XAT9_PSICY|nr:hypothetical protein CVT25_009493 [Psilocybe cyanescens]